MSVRPCHTEKPLGRRRRAQSLGRARLLADRSASEEAWTGPRPGRQGALWGGRAESLDSSRSFPRLPPGPVTLVPHVPLPLACWRSP